MCRRLVVMSLAVIVSFISGTWLVAQKSQDPPPKPEHPPAIYSIYKSGNDDLLLDTLRGKTWLLRRLDAGDLAWLPIQRIDSEKEATQLWRKSTNRIIEIGKSETPFS